MAPSGLRGLARNLSPSACASVRHSASLRTLGLVAIEPVASRPVVLQPGSAAAISTATAAPAKERTQVTRTAMMLSAGAPGSPPAIFEQYGVNPNLRLIHTF